MAVSFSERQAKTIATAITIMAVVVILFAIGAIVWLTASFFRAYASVFLPIAVGAVAALVFRPYYTWLCKHLRLPGPVALLAVVVSMLLPVVAFLWFFGSIIAAQLVEFASQAPVWWEQSVTFIMERWPTVVEFFQTSPFGMRLKDALTSQQDQLIAGLQLWGGKALSAGAVVLRRAGALLSWAVLPVYFAFFLMAKPKPIDSAQFLPFLKKETREDVLYLVREFISIVVAFFRGQLIIAFLQGLLYAFGFSLVGLQYGFILGLALGFLNIIPYLGSIIGLSISLPLSYFQSGGGWDRLLAVLIVIAIVQLIESYVLTPKIMGDRTGLHFMAIIIAIFFWGAALGGILGMILAIPLTAFLASLWRLVREKYITELV